MRKEESMFESRQPGHNSGAPKTVQLPFQAFLSFALSLMTSRF